MKNTTSQKSIVQVGKGTFLGAVLLLMAAIIAGMVFGGVLSGPGSDPSDKAVAIIVVKVLFILGLMLFGGGIYVFIAERRAERVTSSPTQNVSLDKLGTPNWAYVFAGVCLIVGLLGGFIGAIFGFGGASRCIWISRNHAISVPRRIYGCILTAGGAWILYIGWVSWFYKILDSR